MATVCISKLATRPLYYSTDEKNPAFCRDDMWAVSTSELNAITTQRDEMLRCLSGAVMVTEDAGGGEIYLRITPEELAEIERVIKSAS